MSNDYDSLVGAMRAEVEAIPQAMAQDDCARGAIICLLCAAVRKMGYTPVLNWKPPRSTRDSLDLVGVDVSQEIPQVKIAFAVDPLVELAKVKAMEWVECEEKVFVTFSQRADKVKQTTFFLNANLKHLNLYP